MSGSENAQKKRNNYKLLVDPELRKGHKKLYRLNGKDMPGMPPVGEPKDPRTQKTVLGMAGSSMDLTLPRFKFDKDWRGDVPERDVFVIGVSEAMKGSLLKETCSQLAPVHGVKFHHHPLTKTFLGAATVSFTYTGHGKKAVTELDGRIVGGCYLRAELDDKGDHLKKYLEPVLKKCGMERRQLKSVSSDVEEGPSLPHTNSVADSGHDLSESETELSSSVATPITPTGIHKPTDIFLAPSATKLYPVSSLHLQCSSVGGGVGSTSSAAESPSSVLSPTATYSTTPSSLDSGIASLRHGTGTLHSPRDRFRMKFQLPRSNRPPPIPITLPPLPPNDTTAPPLPPLELDAPPPLPPHSPHPPNNHGPPVGIENISSDEEATPIIRDPRRASLTKPALDILSPVSISPPFSPKTPSIRPPNHTRTTNSTFADPSLGLQTFVSISNKNETLPTFALPVTPSPMTYEPEVEDISGDESPIMIYNTPIYDIQVESVSDDDVVEEGGRGGGGGGGSSEDMEVCSGDEDNVIEVNVVPVLRKPLPLPPMLPPPLTLPPPHGFPPPPRPPPFFPPQHPVQFLPPQIFPPPPRLPPPAILPGFKSPPHLPYLHPPNGYVDNFIPHTTRLLPSSRSAGKIKRDLAPPPRNRKDGIGRDVMYKALEQLRVILVNDVQKKLVERYAYRVLENYWEKMESKKQQQVSEPKSDTVASSGGGGGGGEKLPYHVEPYRRMMPGLKEDAAGSEKRQEGGERGDEEEEEEIKSIPTPRKRLINFKIPIINRGGQRRGQNASVVTRRRLFSDEEDNEVRVTGRKKSRHLSLSRRSSYMGMTSDISSEELSEEEEEEEERDVLSEENDDDGEYDVFGGSSNEEDEAEMLQKIFGGDSDSEEEEDNEPIRSRQKRSRQPTTSDLQTTPITKARKLSSNQKEEDYLSPGIDQPPPLTSPSPRSPLSIHPQLSSPMATTTLLSPPSTLPIPEPPKKPSFKPRSIEDEEHLVRDLKKNAPDKEDIIMLRLALGQLKNKEAELVGGVNWSYHPHVPLGAPPTKRRRLDSQDLSVHVTGCARSEGYYKIDARDKVKYLPHHRMKLRLNEKLEKKVSSGRVNRANQRRLASVFSTGDISSDLAKYNQLKARKKLLKFAKSTIHNWGLFAIEAIAADEMVIEYVGEIVRQAVADERERRYEAAGIGSSYLFRVDHDYIIDATRNGNMARFINHCCDPNCYAKVISFGTQKKIVIYSKRDIALGEEITYDYKFPIEDEKIPCLCGAPNCRGTLN